MLLYSKGIISPQPQKGAAAALYAAADVASVPCGARRVHRYQLSAAQTQWRRAIAPLNCHGGEKPARAGLNYKGHQVSIVPLRSLCICKMTGGVYLLYTACGLSRGARAAHAFQRAKKKNPHQLSQDTSWRTSRWSGSPEAATRMRLLIWKRAKDSEDLRKNRTRQTVSLSSSADQLA